MIEYKYPEEKEIVLHYVNLLGDPSIKEIIDKGYIQNSKEAVKLKDFYWAMVDCSVKDQGKGIDVLEQEGVECWMEYIFHSFNGYFVSSGYEKEWDME